MGGGGAGEREKDSKQLHETLVHKIFILSLSLITALSTIIMSLTTTTTITENGALPTNGGLYKKSFNRPEGKRAARHPEGNPRTNTILHLLLALSINLVLNKHKKLDKKCVCVGKELVVAIRRPREFILVVGMYENTCGDRRFDSNNSGKE